MPPRLDLVSAGGPAHALRCVWPLVVLPLGVALGCAGEPFIDRQDALGSAPVDGGAPGESSLAIETMPDGYPSQADGSPVEGDAIDVAPPIPGDVATSVSDPALPPIDGSLPTETIDMGGGGAPNPSGSAPAMDPLSAPATSSAVVPATSSAPDVPSPPENVGGQGPVSPEPPVNVDEPEPPCVDCSPDACGNGVTEADEECDDGNEVDGDGCSVACQSEVCGNGQTTPNEQCDDGNQEAGDGCGPTCQDEFCGDGIVQSHGEQCDDGNEVDTDLCRNECENAASLNSLSSSCAFTDQITQTVCMVATANWCHQFGENPIAGLVTGITSDNEYTVGCIVGFEQKEVATSKLDQCPGGRQQSPSCLAQINTACNELGYDRGFYLGLGFGPNTYAVACDDGSLSTASVPGCNGIADTSPVPVTCAQALSDLCGEGKGGMIQARAQLNQVSYTCVDLSLTGHARQF